MRDSVRVGIIGTGNMGRAHIRCVEALPDAQVVALADTSPDMLKRGLETVGRDVPALDDYRRCLDRPDVDAVVISLPNDLHAAATVDALDADRHVLCEKPMALTLADCDRMIAAAERGGTVLQIGHELRSAPNYRELHRLLARAQVGRVHLLWCHEFRDPFYPKVGNWIVQRRRSGGTLLEKNCHHFDLFNWLTGSRPVRVAAFGGADAVYADGGSNPVMNDLWPDRRDPDTRMDVLDNAWVIVEYESAARACLGVCLFTAHDADGLVVGAIGTHGRLRLSERRYVIEELPVDGTEPVVHRPVISEADRQFSHRGAVLFEHRAFLAAIRGEGPVPVTGRDGRLAVQVALAAEEAVAEKRVVELADVA